MKLALLGTGMIVQELLPVLAGLNIRPHAILGTERSRLRTLELAQRSQIPHCFFRYEEVLDCDADTVYIGLPNFLHYPYAKEALRRGKHVITEKPAVISLWELEELHTLARAGNLIFLEAMTLHHLPLFAQLRQDLPRLGPVRMADLQFCQSSSRYEAFLRGETPPIFDPQLAGGALMDLNVYNIHCALFLFGKPQVLHYQATLQRGIDTSGVLLLNYGDKQVICTAAKDCQGADHSFILGEKGRITLYHPVSRALRYDLELNGQPPEEHRFPEDRHRMSYEFDVFRQIIDGHDLDRAWALQALTVEATRILEAARGQVGL